MDELELLRAFRSDLPELADDRAAAIRRDYRSSPPRRRPPRLTWRRVGLLAAGTAVATGILVSTTLTGGGQSAAAAVLTRAAAHLEARPFSGLPAGSYWYVRTQDRSLSDVEYRVDGQSRTASMLTSDSDEAWTANDGSGATYGVPGTPSALDAAGRQALVELRRRLKLPLPPHGFLEQGPNLIGAAIGGRVWSPAEMPQLPSDEPTLRRLLGMAADSDRQRVTFAEFEAITSALVALPFDPRITAQLYSLLATIPGIQDLGPATDAVGRPGSELATEYAGTRWSVIVDPATGKLLERQASKIAGDADDAQVPLGSVTDRETILASGIVPGLAVRPDGTRLDTTRWTVCAPDPQPGAPSEAHCVDPAP